MAGGNRINSLQDLYNLHYAPHRIADRGAVVRTLMKSGAIRADDPVLSTSTDYIVDVYGKAAFDWLNKISLVWRLLKKTTWDKNGWIVVTADEATTAGVAENGAFPETDKPDIDRLKTKPKYVASPWDLSQVAKQQGKTQDAPEGDLDAFLRGYYLKRHPSKISSMLVSDVNTVAGDNFESLDRVCSSQAEEANCLDVGDADIYGEDRSAGTTFDAYVDENSDVDRSLTLDLIDTMIENIHSNMDEDEEDKHVFITGWDTYRRWKTLLGTKQRFDTMNVSVDRFNGIQTQQGIEGGFNVKSYDGYPIFVTKNIVKDTLSRIYLADMNAIEFRVTMPTRTLNTTENDWLLVDAMRTLHAMVTGGELIAHRFNSSGKIRDLKA